MMAKIHYDYNHLHFFLLITVHYLAIILYPNMVFGQYQSIIAGNTGIVQDSILAINAYCDNTCSNPITHNRIAQCFQQAAKLNDPIIQMIRVCSSSQRNFLFINCNQYSLIQLERCLINISYNNRYILQQQNNWSRQCFRNSITIRTRNCIRYNNPRLRTYLPQRPIYYYNNNNNNCGRLINAVSSVYD
nr:uncharacterized protein LOC124495493 [Dermatophagoides farinae]